MSIASEVLLSANFIKTSSVVTVDALTVTVSPCTVKSPVTVRSLPTVKLLNVGLSEVPSPKEVLTVAPLSTIQALPLDTIKLPSACVNPAIAAKSASYA